MFRYIEISQVHMHVHESQIQMKLSSTLTKGRQLSDMTLLFRTD